MTETEQITKRGGQYRRQLVSLLGRLGFREEAFLIVLACVIGALTGVGSVGFTRLIEWVHGLCYGDSGSEGIYAGRTVMLLVLPCAGALLVGCITWFFAREAKGHGVPEVMDAIARHDGKIRPRVALAKAVSSALTIGSGGSAGTEGPIIQIGAALGSSAGQFFQISRHNMPVLVGCGAAAGISAIFHAPIAGVLFALEIFLRELNFKTFSPVLMASVISSVVVHAMLGAEEAIFPLVHSETDFGFAWFELGNYVILGLFCAVAAVAFIKLLYALEDFFDWLKIHHIAKPIIGAIVLGMLGIGVNFLLKQAGTHEPSIFGNGYPLIGRCIGAHIAEGGPTMQLTVLVLLMLFAAKTLATCFTLGSGGSGGIFAPSLFIGAAVGYAFGLVLQQIGGGSEVSSITPATYALVGMAAVVAATTHAPMTAIIIVFEMTRNYKVILPVMFATTVALVIAQLLYRDSIYTLKLRRRGIQFETRANTAILRRLNVQMVMNPKCTIVFDDTPVQEVIKKAADLETSDFIVIDHNDNYYGLLTGSDLRAALLEREAVPFLVAGELARSKVPPIGTKESLDKVLDIFSRLEVNSLPVRDAEHKGEFLGMITRAALMRRYQQELQSEN
ncbi:MAG: chloride channel protein [Planctomycetes bacterium]|nr:chloride channel protein [Planctomycetota bacterium]